MSSLVDDDDDVITCPMCCRSGQESVKKDNTDLLKSSFAEIDLYGGHLLHVSRSVGLARKTDPEKTAWNKLWPDLEGEKDFNDDHREKITDFVQSFPGFQECDENVVVSNPLGAGKPTPSPFDLSA
ncbi:uncharacterized protein TNCV_4245711 [Trichonephila clavipes]|nr:uncharacterized protein TNCV_4245711 [Trichonephila clavipes]